MSEKEVSEMIELRIGKDEVKHAIEEYLKKYPISKDSIAEIRREDYQEFDTVIIKIKSTKKGG